MRSVEDGFCGRGRVAETALRDDIGRALPMRRRRPCREGRLMPGREARPRFTPLAIAASLPSSDHVAGMADAEAPKKCKAA